MCRLFGLIANKQVDIKFSMLAATNRFKNQGRNNPDGWGIGWYEYKLNKKVNPKITKYGESAFISENFDKLVKELNSKIIIAHVRYASSGRSKIDKNAHPFKYENWIFAHNGTVDKERIKILLKEPYNKDFTSEPIDSEVYFRFIIQSIEQRENILQGIEEAVKQVVSNNGGANFILSDGENLYAFRYGRDLFYLCRDPSNHFSVSSEETSLLLGSKKLANERAIIIATEQITQDEEWKEISNGCLVSVDKNLHIKLENLL